MELTPQKETEKRAYEPPSFRIARLDVRSSVLSSCRNSQGGVSPDTEGCKFVNKCFD